LYKSRIYKINL